MLKKSLLLLAFLAGALLPAAAVAEPPIDASPAPLACVPAAQCCKVCDKGAACGNTCISRDKTCHKGRGCACNSGEICPDPASARDR